MKPSAQIEAAIEILSLIEEVRVQPADQISSNYFRSRRYIGSKDRMAIAELVFGVLRRRNSCDHWAMMRNMSPDTLSPYNAARIRVLAYLWLYNKVKRSEIGILFSGEKHAPHTLSPKERKLFDVRDISDKMPPWIEGEYPEWMHDRLVLEFGDNVAHVMKEFCAEAPVDIRTNSLKTTREDLIVKLKSEGIDVEAIPDLPLGLRCKKRTALTATKAFRDGLFEVQDKGSQILSNLVEAKPGESILDFCAGAGGKTLAIASSMNNRGRIVATDISAKRLENAKKRLKRAGVHNSETRLLETPVDSWLKRQKGKFDKVFVDAPCSGTGTWRRNPDSKWTLSPSDISRLQKTQGEILSRAAQTVRKGGVLIYATCSVLRDENEDVVEKFLEKHPEFTLIPNNFDGNEYLKLYPHSHDTDGFFAAVMKRG